MFLPVQHQAGGAKDNMAKSARGGMLVANGGTTVDARPVGLLRAAVPNRILYITDFNNLAATPHGSSRACSDRLENLISRRAYSGSERLLFPCGFSIHQIEITILGMVTTATRNRAHMSGNRTIEVFGQRNHLQILVPVTGGLFHGGDLPTRTVCRWESQVKRIRLVPRLHHGTWSSVSCCGEFLHLDSDCSFSR
jgi:hypothetical protein